MFLYTRTFSSTGTWSQGVELRYLKYANSTTNGTELAWTPMIGLSTRPIGKELVIFFSKAGINTLSQQKCSYWNNIYKLFILKCISGFEGIG
ncbi:MAG: hypothetical protein IPQ18_14715 [Saprospiraceae bacterium]|nr:hypothetical protein [Saprospiraceae bacterium]